jgi:hypothetical protein
VEVFGLLFSEEEEEPEKPKIAGMKSILKVSVVTVMNGGDNIGTYLPLFPQAKGAEVAVCVVIYYLTRREVVPHTAAGYEAEAHPAPSSEIYACGDTSPLPGTRRVHHHHVVVLPIVHPTH